VDAVARLAFNPESLRPIASGQHPSLITKHNQSPGILLDVGSVDRSGNLEVGVPIKHLVDVGIPTVQLIADLTEGRFADPLRSCRWK
jgi:hypothetical protein